MREGGHDHAREGVGEALNVVKIGVTGINVEDFEVGKEDCIWRDGRCIFRRLIFNRVKGYCLDYSQVYNVRQALQ